VRSWVELRTMACYQRAWALVRDTIRRGRGLFESAMVRDYVERVVKRIEWWRHAGRRRNGRFVEDSICFAGQETTEPPKRRPAPQLTRAASQPTRVVTLAHTAPPWRQPTVAPSDANVTDEPDAAVSVASDRTVLDAGGAASSAGPATGVQRSVTIIPILATGVLHSVTTISIPASRVQHSAATSIARPSTSVDYRLTTPPDVIAAETAARARERARAARRPSRQPRPAPASDGPSYRHSSSPGPTSCRRSSWPGPTS
jgi:hypothetical protein